MRVLTSCWIKFERAFLWENPNPKRILGFFTEIEKWTMNEIIYTSGVRLPSETRRSPDRDKLSTITCYTYVVVAVVQSVQVPVVGEIPPPGLRPRCSYPKLLSNMTYLLARLRSEYS